MRRLAALVTALMLVATPFAAVACESMCAAKNGRPQAPMHTCHQHVAASDGGAAVGGIHVCGHDGHALLSVFERFNPGAQMAAVPAGAIIVAAEPTASAAPPPVTNSSPPHPLHLKSQLRV